MVRVKGAAILARRAFVEEELGSQGWQSVLEALPEQDGELLRGYVLATTWVPFEVNQRLDRAIVETLGGGDPVIFERIGARSARENLSGPHRAFLTPGDPARFMESTARIYSYYYDRGYRTWEAEGPSSGVMTTFEAETFSETDCLTVVGWYREALAMCGAEAVEIEEETCRARGDEVCRYRVGWKPPAAGA